MKVSATAERYRWVHAKGTFTKEAGAVAVCKFSNCILIKSNRQLAESVGRFVPWVKTPEDVIRLIDVYFVQTVAKRIIHTPTRQHSCNKRCFREIMMMIII